MATQSGITIDGPNKPYTVVSNIPRPSPGPRQVLVKCLGVGINPMKSEPLQHHSGLLVNEWPAIIGSDCAAVVVDTGPDCTKLKPGDYVYGCAPLGQNRFTPFQDTFLVEERVFFKKVFQLTAGLCLLAGAELTLPEDGSKAPAKDEWIVVLGGSGSVGQFAVQIAHVCGYKVLASCSPSKDSIAKENGATATFNSRGSTEEQVADIKKITHGNFARIIDSTTYGYEVMVKALETCSTASKKSEFKTPPTMTEYRAELGHLCRLDEALGVEVTSTISSLIPTFETHLAAGTLKPIQYQVVDGMGWDKVIEGIQDLESGKAAKKIVVKVQKE
ncbi:hypothetical protein AK830_g773 [Neonectria ditissima]|uniref:Enoyl reductase (ER) domain-containing protein n=1 Tax=Neonectria ditissima TaxID=78410 RepID=A0A0N8H8X0_9HYPO|nr:hypothetical protein AK830_g773 [Neonectria ditissima]